MATPRIVSAGSVFEAISAEADLPQCAVTNTENMKAYFLHNERREKFLRFALGRHARAGRGSDVQFLVDDVLEIIHHMVCGFSNL